MTRSAPTPAVSVTTATSNSDPATAPNRSAVSASPESPANRCDTESRTPDGIAIDSEGNVYVALNTAGQIAKVDPEGNSTLLAVDLIGPASLAFGQGDFDPCSLYVTSLFTQDLYRVGAGVPGVEK